MSIDQTETSARKNESGLFADMLLRARQVTTANAALTYRERPQYQLVPNILTTGEHTVNTYFQWLMVFGAQTEAGGEGISPRRREHSLLSSRIDSFAKLPKDWGGDDTILVGPRTLAFAKKLVHELPEKWPLPQTTSSPDGEIVFTWFKRKNRLEALLQPDHHLVWVVQKDGLYAPGRDIDLGATPSFADLFEAIALFYQ